MAQEKIRVNENFLDFIKIIIYKRIMRIGKREYVSSVYVKVFGYANKKLTLDKTITVYDVTAKDVVKILESALRKASNGRK